MINLKFAPLIRVSTEKQEQKGNSLSTQKTCLEESIGISGRNASEYAESIKSLNGTIYKWYAGQESATPESERKILAQLMDDAKSRSFDAVMVADISRWSRDNEKSKQYLKILKENEIKFFIGTTDYDLDDPEHSLILGMGAEIGEFFAKQQAWKSIINRIARAEKGIPTGGKLPHGRSYDKKTGQWIVDENKKRQAVVKGDVA